MAKYYSITTKKFTLRTSHTGWLMATRNLYNDILGFYYNLYLDHEDIHGLGKQNALRALEELTIVGRDKAPVREPLPWKKVPLYLRRAAINEAVAAAKSYLGRETQMRPTDTFSSGITLYKGMYKDFEKNTVSVKVFDGTRWCWIRCRLSGNHFSEDDEYLSPRIVFKEKHIEFHVPVRCDVEDGRKLRNRVDKDFKICSLQFTNRDALVIGCIMDDTEHVCSVRFFRGGDDYRTRCERILNKIEKSNHSMGGHVFENMNRKHWKKLQNMSEDMAHQVSSQILGYCRENKVSVIALPKYSAQFTKIVMTSTGKWRPLHLSHRIINQLNYKAWQSGMLVVEVETSDIAKKCAICGQEISKIGENFLCINKHRGNRHLNSCRNLGKKFIHNMKNR